VHGKGEGILRKLVHEYLKKNPNVASFRIGEPAEGGHGVTIATFK
jgi:DNA mismatch repair protein MutS2